MERCAGERRTGGRRGVVPLGAEPFLHLVRHKPLANGEEQPHFEGLLVWNGVQRNLDMLLALDLEGGLLSERGVMSVESYGLVVRDMTAFYSEGTRPIGKKVVGPQGSTARFRQTFKRVRPDRILTTVMRESEHGWVATFPGSDHLAMTRRAKG
jgi:hypothetical protein